MGSDNPLYNSLYNNYYKQSYDVWKPKFKVGDCILWNDKKLTISKIDKNANTYTFNNGLSYYGPSIDNGTGPPHNIKAANKEDCIENPNKNGGKRKTRNNLKNKKTKKYRKSNRRYRRY